MTFPSAGFKVASHYWNTRNLNQYADSGSYEDFKRMTKRINGGYNGLSDRTSRWADAKQQLGCASKADLQATLFPAPVTKAPDLTATVGEWVQCTSRNDVPTTTPTAPASTSTAPTNTPASTSTVTTPAKIQTTATFETTTVANDPGDGRPPCFSVLFGPQPGFCINTVTEACDGADVKSGLCVFGECCPTSKVKDGVDDSRPACSNNQPGFCIDTDTEACDGADVKSGHCAGGSNIKCCPTSKVKGDRRWRREEIKVGVCMHIDKYDCSSGETAAGLCPGSSKIRCQ